MARTAHAYPLTAPEAGPHAHRPIDLVHLARQTLGDRGLECEILHMFDQLAIAYVERVRAAAGADELLTSLHSLKGAAAGVGARGIAELARSAEAEVNETGRLSHERVADLGMAVHEVSAFIAKLLKH